MPNCLASARSRPQPPAERRAGDGEARVQRVAAKRALVPVVTQMPNTVTLPKTATDAELKMIAGSILLALSLILFLFNRRQMFAR